jgi:uncharacterized membrane protein YoaK (UPF0700 family)
MPPPSSDERRLVGSLLLLTFQTGLVDAASVLGLGRIFTANMTGNVVFLGFALGGAHDVSIAASFIALGGFLSGAAVGGRVVREDARAALPIALATEIVMLLAAAVLAALAGGRGRVPTAVLLVLLSMPMGVQNATMRRLGVPDMTTTVLTLTLTGIAADSSFAGGASPRLARRWAAVVAMLVGGWVGAVLLRRGIAWTVAVAALVNAIALGGVLSSRNPSPPAAR